MSYSKQIAIKEVLDIWITKYTDDSPVCYIDYATDATFTSDADRLDLRGGKGNFKLVKFDHTKNATFKLEVPLVDLSLLGYLTGKDLNIGSVTLPRREKLTATAASQIVLTSTPTNLHMYVLSETRDYGTEQVSGTPATANQYVITGGTVTFNATSVPSGTEIICQYDYSSPATTRTITFTADKFPPYVRVCGYGQVTDQIEGSDTIITVFDVKKACPKSNFSITQKSTDATVLTLEFDLYSVDADIDGDGTDEKVYFTMSEMV
jgi:hypothetical protein